MSNSFTCPHCEASYPFKQALVDKAVRCSKCKQPFKLQENGVALAVRSQQQAPPSSEQFQPEDGPSTEDVKVIEAAKQKAAQAAERKAQIKKSHENIRRQMSTTLSAAASQAASSESVKKESQRLQAEKEKTGRHERKGGSSSKNMSVRLSNQGAADSQNSRQWLIGCLLCVCVVIIAGFVFSSTSEYEDALAVFSGPIDKVDRRFPRRHQAHLERCWVMSYDEDSAPIIILNAEESEVGEPEILDLTPAHSVLSKLKGMAPVPNFRMWALEEAHGKIESLWNQRIDFSWWELAKEEGLVDDPDLLAIAFAAFLKEEGVKVYPYVKVLKKLEEGTVLAHRVLSLLLLGCTDAEGETKWMKRISGGSLPSSAELIPFSGEHGKGLLLGKTGYEFPKSLKYDGYLMRLDGDWDEGLRVLACDLTSSQE